MTLQFRQGDVLIEAIDHTPTGRKLNKKDKFLLVRGEGRNHGHFIEGDVDVMECTDHEFELSVKEKAHLKHLLIDSGIKAEHNTISIPPGNYRVIQQREYNPYEKEIQKVQD